MIVSDDFFVITFEKKNLNEKNIKIKSVQEKDQLLVDHLSGCLSWKFIFVTFKTKLPT